jgi:hypothetical protein
MRNCSTRWDGGEQPAQDSLKRAEAHHWQRSPALVQRVIVSDAHDQRVPGAPADSADCQRTRLTKGPRIAHRGRA